MHFCKFHNVKASTGKQKTHSNHDVGWLSPRYHVATTPVWVEITGVWYSGGVSNLCRKLESDQCRQVLPSLALAVGTWTSFCSVFDGGQRCLVSMCMSSMKCFGLLPQVHAQGASLFWLGQSSGNFNEKKRSTRFVVSSIKCFDLSGTIHAKLISVVRTCTRVIYSRAGFGQRLLAWLTSERTCTKLVKVTLGGIFM